jgi:diguanylate cyclase (GGDEF)-like protein/PAS domain S-box-containing protein
VNDSTHRSLGKNSPFLALLLLFIACAVGGISYTIVRLHNEAIDFHTKAIALQTRMLEIELTENLNVFDLLLVQLLAQAGSGPHKQGEFDAQLQTELRRLPMVRSLSLLDAHQHIVASSNPRNLGHQVVIDTFLPVPPPASSEASFLRIGAPWSGRDFADGYAADPQHPVGRDDHYLIPVIRQIRQGRQTWTLLAALNPDFFRNQFIQSTGAAVGATVELQRYDGIVLLSSGEPDETGKRHPNQAVTRVNANEEFGTYKDNDDNQGTSLSAFRASKQYPLLIVTRIDLAQALTSWREERQSTLRLVIPALLAVIGMICLFYLRDQNLVKAQEQAKLQEWMRLSALLNALPAGLVMLDSEGHVAMTNQGWKRFVTDTGLNIPDAGVGMHWLAVLHPVLDRDSNTLAELTSGVRHVLSGVQEFSEIKIHAALPSGDRWFEAMVHSLNEPDLVGAVVMLIDITERKIADARLHLAASVFTHARESIMITDIHGSIIDVNATFTKINGYALEEVVGQNPRILKSGRQSGEFYAAMWGAIVEHGYWVGEVWNRRKSGEMYAQILTISAVRDSDGAVKNYVALASDITPMKEHQKQLERIAHFDALTGLPNRVLFADRLEQALLLSERRKRALSVVYLDLDRFKSVNDSYGHAVGDELLIAVSKRMKTALRDGDSLARFGGDEFVAILTDLESPGDCIPVLERLLEACSTPVLILTGSQQINLHISASIGATVYPTDGADADLLMRHADQAMYMAKQAGRSRYHLFDVEHDCAVRNQRQQLEEIRCALENEEFCLHYQPKVDLCSGKVIGVEALIRWQHPQRGLLAPAEFLPLIENNPLSIAVGDWVLRSALDQIEVWHRSGLALPTSVNIGAMQLQQDNFASQLETLMAAHPQLPRNCLELEILESSAMEDMAKIAQVINACQALGVHFSLDDFGTGFSSLTYLKHLPAESLKIDQSFIRDMLNDADDMAIVNGVIGLAQAFNRNVIAEGVESRAHCDALRAMGCLLVQGYEIARPMPAMEVPDWIRHWEAKPGG